MALTEWMMKGTGLSNCNCVAGCPCQFSQPPTHGRCEAYCFSHVDTGKYGDVTLDGLNWGIVATWPGPIHKGNGTLQAIVDERADARQRAALEAIAHGKDTEPGKIVWAVYAAMSSRFLPTLARTIDLSIDVDARKARLKVPGVVDGSIEPIRNPVTGAESRARINLPNGFEFTEAEVAVGTGKTTGEIKLDFVNTHAHLIRYHWTTHGVVRPS
jgi:hypothetical protein